MIMPGIPFSRCGNLMKAGKGLRGATATTVNGVLETPLYLVNKVRARAGATLAGSIDL